MGANEELGLPRQDKMDRYIVAFDIDGTLRDNTVAERVVINEDIRTLLVILSKFKNIKILVWSGGGITYAHQIVQSMGLEKYVWAIAGKAEYEEYQKNHKIIAIDDIQDTALGNIANLIVREK